MATRCKERMKNLGVLVNGAFCSSTLERESAVYGMYCYF